MIGFWKDRALSALNDRFKDRLLEVDHYFKMVAAVEDRISGAVPTKSGVAPRIIREDLSLKILKATSFLLIYSLVEATVRDSVESIWDSVYRTHSSPLDLRESLRVTWVGAEFRKKDVFSASASHYRDTACDILNAVALRSPPRVNFKVIGAGGNVGKKAIETICSQHGIGFVAPKNTRGGVDLDDVKGRRNVLAHGEQTFEEVGSLYTVSDLKDIKRRVAAYLRHYVKKVEKYIEEESYRAV